MTARSPCWRTSFDGKRLTGPNDVVVKSDGSIWFSDNGAGIRGNYLGHKGTPELPYRVYRIDGRTGETDGGDRRHGAAERPGVLAGRVAAVRGGYAGGAEDDACL